LPTIVEAFTTVTTPKLVKPFTSFHRVTFLRASADNNDDEIERLRSMAAKLRAEAATLEVRSYIFYFLISSLFININLKKYHFPFYLHIGRKGASVC
jgi:hypothetical protein